MAPQGVYFKATGITDMIVGTDAGQNKLSLATTS